VARNVGPSPLSGFEYLRPVRVFSQSLKFAEKVETLEKRNQGPAGTLMVNEFSTRINFMRADCVGFFNASYNPTPGVRSKGKYLKPT